MSKAKQAFIEIMNQHIPHDPATSIDFDRAWNAFNALTPDEQDMDAKIMLSNFLTFSERETDSIRLLFLTNDEQFELQFPIWRAVAIHLYSGNSAKAAEVHEAAQRQHLLSYTGSDLLLAHALRAEDWKLALRVSATVFNSLTPPYDKKNIEHAVHDLWKITTRLHNLRERLSVFLAFAYERLDLQYFVIKAFITHFILATLSQTPSDPNDIQDFLEEIHEYDINEKPFLQFALEKITTTLKESEPINEKLFRYIQVIWSAYRKFCRPGDIKAPIMHDILQLITKPKNAVAPANEVQNLVLDILTTCTNKDISVPYVIMVSVMTMYATDGNTDMVRYINTTLTPRFSELDKVQRSTPEMEADQLRACALLRVQADRGDDEEVERIFTRLQEVQPAVKTWHRPWHLIMGIYAQQQRYGKLFDVLFDRMLNAGAVPTASSFRIVLRELGHRGNVAEVYQLLDIAKRNGIALTLEMVEHVIAAHIASGDIGAAEELAAMVSDYRTTLDYQGNGMTLDKLVAANRANDIRAAELILAEANTASVGPTPRMFHTMVDLYTRNSRTDSAVQFAFTEMPRHGLNIGVHIYGLLVRGYWHEFRYKEAIDFFDRIRIANEAPNSTCCMYWIASLAQMSRIRPATDKEVLTGLRALLEGEFRNAMFLREWPTSWHRKVHDVYFSSLIERYAEVSAWDIVNYLQNWYCEIEHEEPPLAMLKALMKANALAGNHDEVHQLYKQAMTQLNRDIRTMAEELSSLSAVSHSETPHTEVHLAVTSISDGTAKEDLNEDLDKPERVVPVKQPVKTGTTYDLRHLASYIIPEYCSSLVDQGKFDEMAETMSELQDLGFAQNTNQRMWNHYVQCLCKSAEPRHIIAAFRTAELRLMSEHANFRQIDSPEERKMFVLRHRGRKRTDIRIEARSMVMLNEVALAALQTSIDMPAQPLDDSDESSELQTVRLSSVLQQVAPMIYPAVMDWKGNQYIDKLAGDDYFQNTMEVIASTAYSSRQKWWSKATKSARTRREGVFGPAGQLVPFSKVVAVQKTTFIPEKVLSDPFVEEEAPVLAGEMLATLTEAAAAQRNRGPPPRAAWETKLYDIVLPKWAKRQDEQDEPTSELGVEVKLPASEAESAANQQQDDSENAASDLASLFAAAGQEDRSRKAKRGRSN